MTMTRFVRQFRILLLAAVVAMGSIVLLLFVNSVHAESGQAFSISPPLIELKANPGETITTKIKLTNVSSDELLMKTQLNDFGAKNETGEPNIIFDDTKNTSYSLRQWIVSPEPFLLKSKETKELEIPIAVPIDAEPGGHYAVIRFTGTAPELEQSGVALSASIGSLVLLQVSGNITQSAVVEEFYIANARGEKTTFFEQGPITIGERIRNDGNVHVKPTGTLEVVDMFGAVVSSQRINGDPQDAKNLPRSILPHSIRKFDQTLNDGWLFGRYEARMTLSYGENKQPLLARTTFWVVPYKLIILGLLIVVAIVVGGWLGIRKYNAYIIRKAASRKPDDTSAK